MKLPSRYAPVLFAGLLSCVMVSLISALLLFNRAGFHAGFALAWWRSFISTWPVAFLTALVVAPLVRRLVLALTCPPASVS